MSREKYFDPYTNPYLMNRRQFLKGAANMAAVGMLAGAMAPGGLAAQLLAEKKVVLITGAGSGFGKHMALTFAREGYRVYASMRDPAGRNLPKAAALRQIALQEKLSLFVIELDVASPESASIAVAHVIGKEAQIDILINNAGIFVYTPIEIIPRELWELQMRTNVFGPMELTGLVLPHMRAKGKGLVMNVSSRVGRVIVPGISLYATSKFTLETAVEALHYECTPQGIDFAILQPTAFDTDINRNARKIFKEISWPLLQKHRPQGTEFHRKFLETLDNNFAGQPLDNPQKLADLALVIAKTPRADRVLRYPVGDERELRAVKEYNAFTSSLQKEELANSGFGHLYRP